MIVLGSLIALVVPISACGTDSLNTNYFAKVRAKDFSE